MHVHSLPETLDPAILIKSRKTTPVLMSWCCMRILTMKECSNENSYLRTNCRALLKVSRDIKFAYFGLILRKLRCFEVGSKNLIGF